MAAPRLNLADDEVTASTMHRASNGPSAPHRSDVYGVSESKRSHAGAIVLIAVCVAAVLFGAIVFWHYRASQSAAATEKGGKGNRGAPEIVTGVARTGDLPIYIDALGSVTPLNYVTIKTRVDGQIDKIAFAEGHLVKKGDLIAQIDPRPFQVQLETAEGQLARDQATLKNAQVELERDQRAGDAIPKQQIDTQQAAVDQDAAAMKIDQAAIDSAKLQLDYCRVIAPITGVIGLRTVDQGNIVHASDTTGLAVITQVQPITVVFSISEDSLPSVLKQTSKGGHPVVDAYDRDLTTRLATGTLSAIDNQVDATTGMVRIKAEFTNDDRVLYPNQFVNVRLLVDTVKDAVIVPAAAIQRGPDATFVYVLGSDQTVKVRKVTLGASEGDDTVIQSGLEAGETVVTDGVDKLQDGAKVNVRNVGAATSQPHRSRKSSTNSSKESGQ